VRQGAGDASDYANMIWALRLHEATAGRYFSRRSPGSVLDRHYWVEPAGRATSADDTRDVIVRHARAPTMGARQRSDGREPGTRPCRRRYREQAAH
jgi:hypothetical protein